MPPISSTHKRRRSTEMEYLFVYASELQSTQFNMYFITKGAHRNGASVYISMCGVMECSTSENVTPV